MLLPEESDNTGTWLGPQWTNVGVTIGIGGGELMSDLPTQNALLELHTGVKLVACVQVTGGL